LKKRGDLMKIYLAAIDELLFEAFLEQQKRTPVFEVKLRQSEPSTRRYHS
jgi:hypothetical protein